MQDFVLHVIAAHHGRARSHFPSDEIFDPDFSSERAAEIGREAPRRYARLQRKYGRWGLAYLESLVRAADAWPKEFDRRRLPRAELSNDEHHRANSSAIAAHEPRTVLRMLWLMELANRSWSGVEGWFDRDVFCFRPDDLSIGSALPDLLCAIGGAQLRQFDLDDDFSSAIEIPAPFDLRLDWWRDSRAGGDRLKVWAGSMRSARIARAMQGVLRRAEFQNEALLDRGMVCMTRHNRIRKSSHFISMRGEAPALSRSTLVSRRTVFR